MRGASVHIVHVHPKKQQNDEPILQIHQVRRRLIFLSTRSLGCDKKVSVHLVHAFLSAAIATM